MDPTPLRPGFRRALVVVLFLVLGGAAVLVGNLQRIGDPKSVLYVPPFKSSHFHVNYLEFGFVKRGLPGTACQLLAPGFEQDGIARVSFAVALGILGVLGGLCMVKGLSVGAAAAIALSPYTFQNIGFDLGRYDHYGLLAVASIILASEVRRDDRGVLFYGGAGLLMALAVLSHEACVFFVPALAIYLWQNQGSARRLAWFLAPVVVACLALGIWGQYEGATETLNRKFRAMGTLENGLIWTRELSDNRALASLTIGTFADLEANLLVPVITLTAWLMAIGVLMRTRISTGLLLACLAPLLLVLLGLDTARWFALSGFLGTTMIVSRSTGCEDRSAPRWLLAVSWVSIVFLVLSGAAGIMGSALQDGVPLLALVFR